jgi:phage shock protein E
MHWTTVFILVGFVVVLYLLRHRGQISVKDAGRYLRNGALLIDVRSAAEFNAGHLPDAKNIPLEQIAAKLPGTVKDKDQRILLHCQSGMRSGIATKQLKRLGYARVFNLGSYGRASRIDRGK